MLSCNKWEVPTITTHITSDQLEPLQFELASIINSTLVELWVLTNLNKP